MIRIDAQHGFAPPGQGPDWYGKILERNRFEGSVYTVAARDLPGALALAASYPYIRRVTPRCANAGELAEIGEHALIASVRLEQASPEALQICEARQWRLELPANAAIPDTDVPVAVDGIPDAPEKLPDNVYIKLTGFRLPATQAQAERLRAALRSPGPERLMFASGWPHAGATWKETLAAFTQSLGAMPMGLREQLLGATACEFYLIQPIAER